MKHDQTVPLAHTVFDANVWLGANLSDAAFHCATRVELLAVMDKHGIGKCLVHDALARFNHPSGGNSRLLERIDGDERLVPCWVVLPHYTGESLPPHELIAAMKQAGVRAVRALPTVYHVDMHVWLWKELLTALSEHRIPLFLDFNTPNWSVPWPWDHIYKLLEAFPELRLVLVRPGVMANRYVYYLLERFPHLALETSYYQNNNAIVDVCEKFGAERLLYGSALPVFDPRFALGAITCAGIGEMQKAAILGGNLQRLLEGVTWE